MCPTAGWLASIPLSTTATRIPAPVAPSNAHPLEITPGSDDATRGNRPVSNCSDHAGWLTPALGLWRTRERPAAPELPGGVLSDPRGQAPETARQSRQD